MPQQSIVLTGPESTGKSAMARQLSGYFNVPWIPEYARDYLEAIDRPYTEADLLEIAKGQVELEQRLESTAAPFFFLDTSLEVIRIWSEVKFGKCHPWIIRQLKKRRHDYYLLCEPDLAWEFDILRENPADRDALFIRYKALLTELNVNFATLNGLGEKRIENAIKLVRTFTTTNEPPLHP